ncbi:MAG: hypothetical protein ACD_11C00106G0014 [uncultured bacterium]|nr:MAG: hypothetical protein ACD_11C00106G0014 [uncultured bacterium]HBR71389.1 hypothetical protein [Candidatus Moranbacteria bacterium]
MGGFKITIETFEDVRKKMQAKPALAPTKIDHRKETGKPIIFNVILDISGSMDDYYKELINGFNSVMIPSLKQASERARGPMRLGCLLFSEKLVPAWRGFKTLEELGTEPLSLNMFDQPGLKGRTALYGAMRSGIIWTASAMEHLRQNSRGSIPQGKIIILTDGANNENPLDEASVSTAFNGIEKIDAKNLQPVIGFFNTSDGLTKEQFEIMVKKTGFTGLGFYDIARGKNMKEKQASFRHQFGIFSSQACR